ncbi:MAG: EAL domain-containing protein [Acidobacteriota bacterium]|nr:EAL domain-containing protein [Acidobacteriota bacterium]
MAWLFAVVCMVMGAGAWVYLKRIPHRTFRIGFNNAPPYYTLKPDGSYYGLAIDAIDEAARRRGISIQWTPILDREVDDAFASKFVDLWPVVASTPARATHVHLTKPWLQNNFCLLSRKDSEITSAAGAAGLKVAHSSYPMATAMAKQFLAHADLVTKKGNGDVISAVCRGEVQAGFLEARTLDPILLKRPRGCESIAFSIHFIQGATSGVSMASTFETAEVAEALRSEISNLISDGSVAASMDKWSSFSAGETRSLLALQQAERRTQYILYGFFGALIAAFVLFWQFREARRSRRIAERAILLEADRNRVLESLAAAESVSLLLGGVSELIERQYPELICAVSVRQDDTLRLVCRSRLPESLASALAQVVIEDGAVCSGQSAFERKPVASAEILVEPRWESRRAEVQASGLKSCWAVPICSGSGLAMGVIAVYLKTSALPNAAQVRLLESAAQLACVAIERRLLYEQLQHQANHDTLTGLPNRALLLDRLQQALASAQRQKRQLAVLCIDLDRFKQINDTLGHGAGDLFLKGIAGLIRNTLRASDTLARMGGDEFTVLVAEIESPEAVNELAERLIEAIRQPVVVEGVELFGSASIGIGIYPQHGATAEDLQRNADNAMYQAKDAGKNRYKSFAWEMTRGATESAEMERDLREALDNGYFELHYQPQFSRTGKLLGAEALIRLRHPSRGLIQPSRFIPCAEESGLIAPIGQWVLFEVCRQLAEWQQKGLRPVRIAINVSARQLAHPGFSETVACALAKYCISPALLELELTETAVMRNIDESMAQFRKFRALGVRLAIDDFGTGYSSLSYLQRLPVNAVKIDQSFIREGGTFAHALPLVQAIVAASRSLGLEVVAEGVETAGQHESVCSSGCDIIQGFFLSQPVLPSDLESFFPLGKDPALQKFEIPELAYSFGFGGGNSRAVTLS